MYWRAIMWLLKLWIWWEIRDSSRWGLWKGPRAGLRGQGGGQGVLWQEGTSMSHLKELYLSFALLQIQFTHTHTHTEVAQSCPTLCNPMDCSPPGSLVHGIFQAWILEWVDVSFSRGSSWPRDRTPVSRIVGRRFTIWATREAHQKHRRVVVSFKRTSVEIFYRWNLLPRSQLANYMHSWRQEAAKVACKTMGRNRTFYSWAASWNSVLRSQRSEKEEGKTWLRIA